jgi:hypothetical protein
MGATVTERDESGEVYPDSVSLTIVGPRKTTIGIRFHRQRVHETNNIWVGTWNTHYRGPTVCFADSFETPQFRPYPKYSARNKATRVWYGFDHLMASLERDLAALNDGSAFDDAAAAEYDARTARGERPWQRILRSSPENGQKEQSCNS